MAHKYKFNIQLTINSVQHNISYSQLKVLYNYLHLQSQLSIMYLKRETFNI